MKKLITLLFFINILNISHAQVIWNWAQSATTPSGSTGSEGTSGARDNNGNFYVCGVFYGPGISFGSYSLTAQVSPGTYNLYLVKYDTNGNLQWATGATNPTVLSSADNVCTDSQGNVYMVGSFNSSIVLGNYTLTSAGSQDMYLAKYNTNGVLQWVLQGGGSGSETCYGVCTDIGGNTYITGSMSSSVCAWGTFTLGATSVVESYLIKVNSSGNVVWGTKAISGNSGVAYGRSLALDGSGNLYWAGHYSGSATFGTIAINSTAQTDYYLAKYTTTGTSIWAVNTPSGSANEQALIVTCDNSGNPYLGGYFTGTLGIASQTYSQAVGFSDGFLVKYNASGIPQWSRVYRGSNADRLWSICSYSGGIFVAGNATPNFTMAGVVYPAANNTVDDCFIENIDFSGNLLYSNIANGGGDDFVTIFVDDGCSVYLTSDYAVMIPTVNYTLTLPQGVSEVAFLAKLNLPPHVIYSGNNICAGNSASIIANGATNYTWSANAGGVNTASVIVSPSVNTIYSVSASNSCGVSNSTVLVSINQPPAINITSSSNSVCPGNTVILSASSSGTVNWSNGVINGIAFTPSVTNIYTAMATSSVNCSATSTIQVRVLNLPAITPAASASAICPGQSATLSAGSAGNYTWQPGSVIQPSLLVTPSITQTYTVYKIDSTCVNSATLSLLVLQNPSIQAVSSRTLICVGQPVVLTANGAVTYTWNTGVVSPTINATTTNSTTLVYSVTGTGTNGCVGTTTISIKVNACTGLNDVDEKDLIKIYPNPAQITLWIEFATNDFEIKVMDAYGRIIKGLTENYETETRLTLNGFTPGIYFVSLTSKGNTLVKKVIIE